MNSFNTNRTIQDMEKLAYPRFVGTDGEKKAAEYIKKEFKKTGLEVFEEEFTYSLLPVKVFRKAGHLLQVGTILLIAYLLRIRPFLSLLLSVFLFVVLCLSTHWSKFLNSSLNIGSEYPSRNIVASHKGPVSEKKVILMAHYDTKSQFLPMRMRIPIRNISIFGGMVFALAIIVSIISSQFLSFSIPSSYFLYSGLFLSVLTILLFFNKTGNESPGVIDNASGVSIILETARRFSEKSPENLDIKFVATSAEEIGLVGAINFLESHKKELDIENVYLINLDVFGPGKLSYNQGYGLPITRTSRYLNGLIEKIAKENNIEVRGKYILSGLAADYMPFVGNGYEATWLHSSMSGVHTKDDNLEQIDKKTIENAGIITQELICKIGKD